MSTHVTHSKVEGASPIPSTRMLQRRIGEGGDVKGRVAHGFRCCTYGGNESDSGHWMPAEKAGGLDFE